MTPAERMRKFRELNPEAWRFTKWKYRQLHLEQVREADRRRWHARKARRAVEGSA